MRETYTKLWRLLIFGILLFVVTANFNSIDVQANVIIPGSTLDTPVLYGPADGAHFAPGDTITFDWSSVAPNTGSIMYEWEITQDPTDVNDWGQYNTGGWWYGSISQMSEAISTEGVWYWHVYAFDDGQEYSDWSEERILTVGDDAYEENDDRLSAYDLSSDEQTWLSAINGPGIQADDDWYEIYISSGYTNLIVDLQFTHAHGDIDIAVYDSSGTFITSETSTSDNEYIDYSLPSSGTYYLRVYYADQGNSYDLWWDDIQETGPDLVITSGSPSVTPSTVSPGDDVTLSAWTVANQGDASCSSFYNGFYLSTNSIISAGDTYLDGNSNTGKAPGEDFDWGSPTVTIPAATAPGDYYIGILVDIYDDVAESDENNNYVSTPITIQDDGNDIIIGTRSIDPDSLTPGGTFTVEVTLEANGDVTAPALDETVPSGWTVTPVDNAGFTYKASTVQWVLIGSWSAGDSATIVYDVTIPSGAAYTTYYLNGEVSGTGIGPFTVGGETTITATQDWCPWDDDSIITLTELQDAINHWVNDIPKNAHDITLSELQDLITIWINS